VTVADDLAQPRERDRIQCLECGRWFRALSAHFRRAHSMADEDYRLKYGIPVGTPLVCPELSEDHSRHSIERGLGRNLTARGPSPGFEQRESVRSLLAGHYAAMGRAGRAAAAKLDRTAERRAALRPYPVTVAEASGRLGCTTQAAYNFLSRCVASGRLRRIGPGAYDEGVESPEG
jgi:hypothetical protein